MRLLEEKYSIEHLVIHGPKGSGLRMKAGPGTKDYGAFPWRSSIMQCRKLSAGAGQRLFTCSPRWTSVLLGLKMREQPSCFGG